MATQNSHSDLMDTQNSSFFKTHFGFFNLGGFLSPKMSSLFAYFFTLFTFIKQYFFRLKKNFIPQKQNSKSVLIQLREEEEGEERKQTDSSMTGKEIEPFLSFRFRTYEEFIGKNGDDQVPTDDEFFEVESMEDDEAIVENSAHNSVHAEEIEEAQISREINQGDNSVHAEEIEQAQIIREINQGDNSVHFEEIEEPQINAETQCSADNSVIVEGTEEYRRGINSEVENPQRNVVNVPAVTEVKNSQRNVINVPVVSDVVQNSEGVKVENEGESLKNSANNGHLFSDDDESLVSDSDLDSDLDSMVSTSKFSFRSSIIDSMSDGFLSDIDFEKAFEVDFDGEEAYSGKKVLTEEDIELENLNRGYETDDFEDEDEEILKELKNLERQTGANEERKPEDEQPPQKPPPQPPKRRVSFAGDRTEDERNGEKPSSGVQSGENPSSGEQLSSDSEEQSALERQWEHQDLVEQLKMEIKKVRAIGLPTILEESDSLKITEDLKPWKIEEKFQHEDTMDELHKFYKSYRERMRKLDILNYQKMYAIGFLRGKDPLQSFTRNKLSVPAMAAIVSLDCWSCKGKSAIEVQQPVMKKFSRELESDLEMVYVGQMCLSWEFLRWQHDKALKLWGSDLHGIRRYNEVADKFQQFQVLLTRFLEDEPVQQGSRVRQYVESRYVLRNLLQVPVIREDNLRDKKKERRWVSRKDAITSVKLVETIEESIRVMRQFIRSDTSTTSNAILTKCKRGSYIELQNPADAVLLEQIRSNLQKKEKKLKELRKSENCILRKIQKQQHSEEGLDEVDYFFSQVDLKLVSRVLNMSRITTEQLGWCSDKLKKINVVGGKLYVQSTILLFPCS